MLAFLVVHSHTPIYTLFSLALKIPLTNYYTKSIVTPVCPHMYTFPFHLRRGHSFSESISGSVVDALLPFPISEVYVLIPYRKESRIFTLALIAAYNY